MRRFLAFAVVSFIGCTRSVYPAPAAQVLPPTHGTTESSADTQSLRARLELLDSQCRQQPSAVARSLSAVDDIRAALGSMCTVESVDNDPMLWLFRCQTDAFFPLGQFAFPHRAPHACANEPGVRGTNGWVCAGAALERLLAQPDSGLESARIVFVGHVDQVHLQPENAFEPCGELARAWHYTSGQSWETLHHGDPRLDTLGNNELAWCRAASVAQQVVCGMQQRGASGHAVADCSQVTYDAATNGSLAVGLVGASSLWQRHQPRNVCPQCDGVGSAQQCECNSARRVDVFVQFRPHESAGAAGAGTMCQGRPGMSADARALYCLQECLEGRSVLAEEVQLERHNLLGDCATGDAAQSGWYEQVQGGSGTATCQGVQRDLIGRVLGL